MRYKNISLAIIQFWRSKSQISFRVHYEYFHIHRARPKKEWREISSFGAPRIRIIIVTGHFVASDH